MRKVVFGCLVVCSAVAFCQESSSKTLIGFIDAGKGSWQRKNAVETSKPYDGWKSDKGGLFPLYAGDTIICHPKAKVRAFITNKIYTFSGPSSTVRNAKPVSFDASSPPRDIVPPPIQVNDQEAKSIMAMAQSRTFGLARGRKLVWPPSGKAFLHDNIRIGFGKPVPGTEMVRIKDLDGGLIYDRPVSDLKGDPTSPEGVRLEIDPDMASRLGRDGSFTVDVQGASATFRVVHRLSRLDDLRKAAMEEMKASSKDDFPCFPMKALQFIGELRVRNLFFEEWDFCREAKDLNPIFIKQWELLNSELKKDKSQ